VCEPYGWGLYKYVCMYT